MVTIATLSPLLMRRRGRRPVDRTLPGVEVHAQILESALTRTTLTAPVWTSLAELAAMLVIGLGLIWFAPKVRATTLFLAGGVVADVGSLLPTLEIGVSCSLVESADLYSSPSPNHFFYRLLSALPDRRIQKSGGR
jgi:hypothetical protein